MFRSVHDLKFKVGLLSVSRGVVRHKDGHFQNLLVTAMFCSLPRLQTLKRIGRIGPVPRFNDLSVLAVYSQGAAGSRYSTGA